MRRSPLHLGWEFRPKNNRFAEKAGLGAEWQLVTLPHDALIGQLRSPEVGTEQTAYYPGGIFEYRHRLDVDEADLGQVTILDFEGVHRSARVAVNGVQVVRRPYGYSRFQVQVDHLLVAGANTITVEARSHQDSRWYTGAGIHRDVWLLRSGRLHLAPSGLTVATPEVDDEVAVVTVAAEVRDQGLVATTSTLVAELVDPDGSVVASTEAPLTTFPGDDMTARLRLHVPRPRRWRLDDPQLYTCRVELRSGDLLLDEDTTTFGIRSLTLDPVRGLRLNGEPTLLRGACVHHDNGPIGAAGIGRADERRIEILKAAGFNAVRSAHQPMSRAMLDACDRIGMLVMDEAFDMWTETKTDDDFAVHFADWWETDVEAMVRNSRNHPSVIFYSIGNEIPDGARPAGVRTGRLIAEKVRSLDDTRYLTQAVSGILVTPGIITELMERMSRDGSDEETGINTAITTIGEFMAEAVRSPRVDENTVEAFSVLDVAGYNYMPNRFTGDVEAHPDRVIVSTESHPPSIVEDWAAVVAHDAVIGDFTWTGWDYLGEVGVGRVEYGDEPVEGLGGSFMGEYPWRLAWCADVDITGRRRPQSYLREIAYGLRTDPYLAVERPQHHGRHVLHQGPWSFDDVVASWTWPGREGAPVSVRVYADAEEVELLLDDRSIGTSPVKRCRAVFETIYEPGTLEAVARRDGVEVGRTRLRSASGPVRLLVEVDRPTLRVDHADLAFVSIELVDEAGICCPTADREIRVELEGPAVLQGLASADPCSENDYTGDRCPTFDGRALAVVRPTAPGRIRITVRADGCSPAEVEIRSCPPA